MEKFPTLSSYAPRERTRLQRIYDRARQVHVRNALSRIALQASAGEPSWLRRLRRDTLLRHWWELGNEA